MALIKHATRTGTRVFACNFICLYRSRGISVPFVSHSDSRIKLSQKSILETNTNEIGSNLDISDSEKRHAVSSRIIALLKKLETPEKEEICRSIATVLGFDFEEIVRSRQFSFMTFDEIRDANKRGLDIQLHTHTHTADTSTPEKIATEIQMNKEKLIPYVSSKPEHFCYPSGVHNTAMHQYIKQDEIISATITDAGFVMT